MISVSRPHSPNHTPPLKFHGVRLTSKSPESLWNVCCKDGFISEISEYEENANTNPDGRLVAPSLCHPHIHLDKCFLLSHPKYADLEIEKGDFEEALRLTSEL